MTLVIAPGPSSPTTNLLHFAKNHNQVMAITCEGDSGHSFRALEILIVELVPRRAEGLSVARTLTDVTFDRVELLYE